MMLCCLVYATRRQDVQLHQRKIYLRLQPSKITIASPSQTSWATLGMDITNDPPPPRILIIDDDSALLEALPETIRLRIPETIVDTARSSAEAMQFVAAIDHDVIVTDLVLPDMTGLDLICKMREVRRWTPMILMTGGPHPGGDAFRTRSYGFIQKPIDREYLIATLRRAVRYARLAKRIQAKTQDVQKHLDLVATLQRQMVQHAARVCSHSAGGQSIAALSALVTSTSSHRS